jgi:hypothetical protein
MNQSLTFKIESIHEQEKGLSNEMVFWMLHGY